MQIARARVDEMAAPVTVLVCDGAFYDLATLEERWGWDAWGYASDFHTRVLSLRCAGLAEVDARLRSGDRPTEARLLPGDLLPLAPCDDERAAYVQLAPRHVSLSEPAFALRDARSLVGDGQPVVVRGAGALAAELGLAAIVAEELEGASAAEAGRAILGFSLLIDWTLDDRWSPQALGPRPLGISPLGPPSQLGPFVTTGLAAGRVRGLEATARVGERKVPLGPVLAGGFHPHEAIAFVSGQVALRPGDVVGLGAIGRLDGLALGDRVTLEVRGLGRLTGWAVAAADPVDWRLKSGR